MGYRSDVGLVLTRHGVTVLHKRLKTVNLPLSVKDDIRNLLRTADEHHKDNDTGSEVWLWNWIKWYDSEPYFFDEIKFIADTIQSLPEKDYRFIRIGENYDDIEVDGSFWDNPFDFDIERTLSITPIAQKI